MTGSDGWRNRPDVHAGHDLHSGHGGTSRQGHGGHHWMILVCCIPMIIIVAALIAAGAIGISWVVLALACVAMMWLMMRAMDQSMGGH